MPKFLDENNRPVMGAAELSEELNTKISDMYEQLAEQEKENVSYEKILAATIMSLGWLLGQVSSELEEAGEGEAIPSMMMLFLSTLGSHSPIASIALMNTVMDAANEVSEVVRKAIEGQTSTDILPRNDPEDTLH